MKFSSFELRRPRTEEQAIELLCALGSDAQVLAGGQSLLPLMRYRMLRPHVLVDINGIESLATLERGAEGWRIGALVRHATLEAMAKGRDPAPLESLLGRHASQIAFWAVRNRGTAVGSVVQADPKGDWPLMMCALDARIELASLRGRRQVPVRQFIEGPLMTGRQVDELATALLIDARRARLLRWGRAKLMHRAGEYASCSALALVWEDEAACWVGALGDRPVALPGLGDALARPSSLSTLSRSALLEIAEHDLTEAVESLDRIERRRHAVNAVDAVQQIAHQDETAKEALA